MQEVADSGGLLFSRGHIELTTYFPGEATCRKEDISMCDMHKDLDESSSHEVGFVLFCFVLNRTVQQTGLQTTFGI